MKDASTFWTACVAAMILAVVSGSAALASDEISKEDMIATASSDGYGWVPSKAINGIADQDEGWHANAGAGAWLRIDLGDNCLVDRYGYQPRGAVDGRINGYEIYVTESTSTEYGNWGDAAASGNWANTADRQYADLTPTLGRYVFLYAVSVYSNSAGANEVYIYGMKLGIDEFVVKDQTSDSTIWTDTATVDVTIAASTLPDATILGYIVSQSATAPPLSDTWLDPLTTYPITGGEGVITLYGWAKDSMDRTASKSVVIGYAATALPAISNISVTLGSGVIAITWDTDANAIGWVEYGLSGGALDSTSSLDYGTSHEVVLSGLGFGESYDYVIHSNDSVTASDTATTRDVVTWSGPDGFADGDGSWNLATNWDSGAVPSPYDIVLLPNTAIRTRTIAIDADAEVAELRLDQTNHDYDNAIILNANLTAHKLTLVSNGGWSQMHYPFDVNGKILTIHETSNPRYWGGMPNFSGGGQIVKAGTGTAWMGYNSSVPFTGSFVVNGGVLRGWPSFPNAQGVTVNSGGTFWEITDGLDYGGDFTLNGPGANDGTKDLGALRITGNPTATFRMTFETDSTIYVDASRTLTLGGVVDGDGGLNKTGAGTLLITGATAKTYTGETIVSEGTMEVKTALADSHVTVKAGATLVAVPSMVPQGVTVEEGGTWDQGLPPGWWGDGDPNNNGDWSDPDNWGEGGIPGAGDVALLPTVTGYGNHPGDIVRNVTVDVPVTIADLKFPQIDGTFRNNILLAADFTLGTISEYQTWAGYSIMTVSEGTTLRIGNGNVDSPLVMVYGTGTVRKVGTGKVTYRAAGMARNFHGSFIVEDGIFSGVWLPGDEATVEDGATAELNPWIGWDCATTINGEGFDGQGAVHVISDSGACSGVLTIATDSTINVDEAKVLTLSGGVEGTSILTKTGLGTILITGGEKIYTGETVVSEGTVDVRTTLAGSHVTVKSGATLMGPPMWFPQGVTVEEGGTWDAGPNYWWGNGDSNNDGDWSDGANWVYGAPPAEGEVALFPVVNGNGNSGTNWRTVTIDVPVTITDLKLPQTGNFINSLTLGADLTIAKISEYNNWAGYSRIDVPEGRTLKLGEGNSDSKTPSLYGSGTVRKIGTGRLEHDIVGGNPGFSGELIIEEGVFYVSSALKLPCTVEVKAGATLHLRPEYGYDPATTIAGQGYEGQGAIRLSNYSVTMAKPMTITADATINVEGGQVLTLTQTGEISGPGGITKAGAGTLSLAGTCATDVKVASGTLAIEDDLIDDYMVLSVALGGTLDMADLADEHVSLLYFGAESQRGGSWGRTGSGADNINNVYFSGRTGIVTVDKGATLEGDVNDDCVVNILDLIGIRNHLNQDPNSPEENKAYNVNGDDAINILDMIYVRNRLNSVCE